MASAFVITFLFLPLTIGSTNNIALLQPQPVFAQQQQAGVGTTDFLAYENPTYGIFMQYSSDWITSTNGLVDYTDLIAFYSPLQNVSDTFPARLTISVIPYSQNISLPEYTDFVLTILNESQQVDVRSSSEVSVAGYPGFRIVLAVQPSQNSTLTLQQMNTWTAIGDKVYSLRYEGDESTFNRYLPEVSQMLESFVITGSNNNNSTSTTMPG
jgi:hypothetical protein